MRPNTTLADIGIASLASTLICLAVIDGLADLPSQNRPLAIACFVLSCPVSAIVLVRALHAIRGRSGV